MLILHIVDSLSPDRGGPPEAVRQLAKAYLEIGDRTEVVCLDNPDAAYLKNMPCPVHALGQSYLGRYAFSLRLWRWLDENVNRFDGLVMNGIWSFPGLALSRIAQRHGRRYGIFVHGALDPWFNRKYPLKRIKKIMYWPCQYSILRDALAVFFTTEQERKLAQKSFSPNRWNGVVVPYGITDPEGTETDANRQIENFYASEPRLRGRRYFLFLARIHEKKGCDLLVEAFAQIARLSPDVDLVVAGPDPTGMKTKLKRIAEAHGVAERVHWPGLLSGDVKWGALRACEAFVLPSHQENFGIAVVETLAMSRPVLISKQVNIYPAIEEDGVGLEEDDTLEGTRRLLTRWLEMSRDDRAAMAQKTRTSFLRRYAMSRAARAINETFSLPPKPMCIEPQ
jgi:glycosyltransferase involved in cell wall biosynthesis